MFNRDIDDWTITFADTGANTILASRFKAVEKYLDGEEMFLANYSDNLTDFNLPEFDRYVSAAEQDRGFPVCRPSTSCHYVSLGSGGQVEEIKPSAETDMWINGGYFVFKRSIFEYIKPGEELVQEPFRRLIAAKQLMGHAYRGFWKSMDTFKEKQELDDLYTKGTAPWQLWKRTSLS